MKSNFDLIALGVVLALIAFACAVVYSDGWQFVIAVVVVLTVVAYLMRKGDGPAPAAEWRCSNCGTWNPETVQPMPGQPKLCGRCGEAFVEDDEVRA